MSRLSKGEHEFVSFGDPAGAPAAPATVPEASQPSPSPSTPPTAARAAGPEVIDARGISSPLPVLRAHRALRAMQPGQELKVITSSGATIAEFQALSKYVIGYELLSQEETGGEVIHLLRKKR
jgi:tRNA 2-thiouridine synthesizing protein A